MRIVSLVPSLTETVASFGLREQLVGCTKFCVEPKGLARTARMVGGTKDPDLEEIRSLAPTHILVNEEENKPEHIAACREIAPTLTCFPRGPEDVPTLLRDMGAFLEVTTKARELIRKAEFELQALREAVRTGQEQGSWKSRNYLYFIWREPYMLAGEDTYISRLLGVLGWQNLAPQGPPQGPRYPEVDIQSAEVREGVDLVLLSSEPYPFRRRDAERLRGEWPGTPEIRKIDGRLLSWYGAAAITAFSVMRSEVEGRASPAFSSPL